MFSSSGCASLRLPQTLAWARCCTLQALLADQWGGQSAPALLAARGMCMASHDVQRYALPPFPHVPLRAEDGTDAGRAVRRHGG